MQHARVFTVSSGAWPRPLELDVAQRPGVRWELVGFAERVLKESPQRVRHAWRSTSNPWPTGKWVISLSPAALPKFGASVDLPLALAIALASRRKKHTVWAMGELHFDGRVLPVPGIASLIPVARAQGAERIVLPRAVADEMGPHEFIYYVDTLSEALQYLDDWDQSERLPPRSEVPDPVLLSPPRSAQDKYKDLLRAHPKLQWAALAAAHGGHHAFFWASLKDPWAQWVEAVRLAHLAASGDDSRAFPVRLITNILPSSGSIPGMVDPIAHELTQAHEGLLGIGRWLEQDWKLEERLTQVLDRGTALLGRGQDCWAVPARVQLALISAPCACGAIGTCICSSHQLRSWKNRLQRPFMDRFDVACDWQDSKHFEFLEWEEVGDRMRDAAERWSRRFEQAQSEGWSNRQVPAHRVMELFHVNKEAWNWFESEHGSVRSLRLRMAQILRIARSLADIHGTENIEIQSMKQAVLLNSAYF